MSRPLRVHIPNAVYYLRLTASGKKEPFKEPEAVAHVELCISRASLMCDCYVHGCSVTPHDARLVVQIADIPLGDFAQRITCAHSRWLNLKRHTSGVIFQRHRAVLIRQESYVLKAVRYVHLAPLHDSQTDDPAKYAHSSHRAYLGLVETPWLTTQYVRKLLAARKASYREYMQTRNPRDGELLERGPTWVPCDGVDLMERARRAMSRGRSQQRVSREDLDAILMRVSSKLRVPNKEILSASRARRTARARALITWKAMTEKQATLHEVACYLDRDPSSLSTAVYRYWEREPQLFGGVRRR